MKKFFSILAVSIGLLACNGAGTDNASSISDSTPSVQPEPMAPSPVDTVAGSAPTMNDGVMAMKDGQMMVMKGGSWEPMKETITTTNGRKVKPNGEVSNGTRKKKLEEGQMIDKEGQMIDRNGKMMDTTGWE